jgi:hypothetical protein
MGSRLISHNYLISTVSLGLVTRGIGAVIKIIKGFPRLNFSKTE